MKFRGLLNIDKEEVCTSCHVSYAYLFSIESIYFKSYKICRYCLVQKLKKAKPDSKLIELLQSHRYDEEVTSWNGQASKKAAPEIHKQLMATD